eukprot:5794039-Amphidinium_carterae.1
MEKLNDEQQVKLHAWVRAYTATSSAVRAATDLESLQKINLMAPEPPPNISSTVLMSVCSQALHVGEVNVPSTPATVRRDVSRFGPSLCSRRD